MEVHSRSTWSALVAGASALPHNLWPWTIIHAEAAAYAAAEPDILDYTPTAREWLKLPQTDVLPVNVIDMDVLRLQQ